MRDARFERELEILGRMVGRVDTSGVYLVAELGMDTDHWPLRAPEDSHTPDQFWAEEYRSIEFVLRVRALAAHARELHLLLRKHLEEHHATGVGGAS